MVCSDCENIRRDVIDIKLALNQLFALSEIQTKQSDNAKLALELLLSQHATQDRKLDHFISLFRAHFMLETSRVQNNFPIYEDDNGAASLRDTDGRTSLAGTTEADSETQLFLLQPKIEPELGISLVGEICTTERAATDTYQWYQKHDVIVPDEKQKHGINITNVDQSVQNHGIVNNCLPSTSSDIPNHNADRLNPKNPGYCRSNRKAKNYMRRNHHTSKGVHKFPVTGTVAGQEMQIVGPATEQYCLNGGPGGNTMCTLCQSAFSRRWNACRHVAEVHLQMRFACPHCTVTKMRYTALVTHIKAVHQT